MKAIELQIFDWVLKRGENHAKVTGIDYNGTVDTSCGITIDVYLKPIPLTSEILERNGFVIKKKWAQKGNFGDNPLIMWHYDDDTITRDFKHELEIHQNDTGKVHISVQCDYVHEFQHALRLCGLHEWADNFKVEE